jgi:hypothetical protein
VQGSAAAEGSAQVRLQDVVQASGSRPLSIACADLDPAEAVRVFTPTFNPRDVDRMLTYDLLASPTLKPGRTTRAHVKAVLPVDGPIEAALNKVDDSNGAIQTVNLVHLDI